MIRSPFENWNHESLDAVDRRRRNEELGYDSYDRFSTDAGAWMSSFLGEQAERHRDARRIEAIVAGAETDPIELNMLGLIDHPDYRTFNIVEDW